MEVWIRLIEGQNLKLRCRCFATFFAVMRCLSFFSAVLQCGQSPNVPLIINTFLHVIYKSKKKTNLLCILNNVFQFSKIRTRKRNAKKSIKTEKNLESSPFWNPESTELESGIHRVESRIQDCHGFPYMGRNRLARKKKTENVHRSLK